MLRDLDAEGVKVRGNFTEHLGERGRYIPESGELGFDAGCDYWLEGLLEVLVADGCDSGVREALESAVLLGVVGGRVGCVVVVEGNLITVELLTGFEDAFGDCEFLEKFGFLIPLFLCKGGVVGRDCLQKVVAEVVQIGCSIADSLRDFLVAGYYGSASFGNVVAWAILFRADLTVQEAPITEVLQ